MQKYLIKNANIVNEGMVFSGNILIENDIIRDIYTAAIPDEALFGAEVIDAHNHYVLPGVIDDQVHFREPGLTHKGEIYTESRAAVAGGITSYMEMPNVIPTTTTQELLQQKYELGAQKSLANYSFYMGGTNDNLSELLKTDPATVCGIKIFMGSSTGNMLVDNPDTLKAIFSESPMLIAVHCEDEQTIQNNTRIFREKYGEDIPIIMHPQIRSAEACYKSSSLAVELASKYNTRLHVLHLSTAREISLFSNAKPARDKRITSEVCVHHLWFDESEYPHRGTLIKWNPAIKSMTDRDALLEAVNNDTIDVIATDHAPHTLTEKQNTYFKAPSGAPMVQHSLVAMLELYHQSKISLEQIVRKMCHLPADVFKVAQRGYIRSGYKADLVIVDLNKAWTVSDDTILYKCGWSPLQGLTFHSQVTHTFVNGHLAYCNGVFDDTRLGERLRFERG